MKLVWVSALGQSLSAGSLVRALVLSQLGLPPQNATGRVASTTECIPTGPETGKSKISIQRGLSVPGGSSSRLADGCPPAGPEGVGLGRGVHVHTLSGVSLKDTNPVGSGHHPSNLI